VADERLTAEEAVGETVLDHATLRAVDARLAAKGWKSDVDSAMLANPRIDLRALCPAAFAPPAPKMVRAEVRVNGWRFRAIGGGFVTFGPLADTASAATLRAASAATLRAALALLDRCDANGMWPEGTTVDAETVPSTPPNVGFTQEDVALLRHLEPGPYDWDEEIGRRIKSLCDRIAALLPPSDAMTSPKATARFSPTNRGPITDA
jgi:hypothetical protein